MIKNLRPEKFFLISGLIVGILLCFLVPIGAGYDEDTHVARIWEMSHGNFIPNSYLYTGPNFPSVFYELSYRQKNLLDPVSLDLFSGNMYRRIDWDNMIWHSTRSLYNPFLYIMQAFIMGLMGRLFDAPVMIIYFLCRFSYLLFYIFFCYLAIKMIPFGKWLLTSLALAPMAITQASIISADAITHSVCFLFLAYLLLLRFREKKITSRDLWILLGIIALLFTVKINGLVLVLLLFLIPIKKFESKSLLYRLIAGVVILFIFLVVGWNYLAFTVKRPFIVEAGVDPAGQVLFILTHPLQFVGIVINNLIQYGAVLLKEWIGVMGYRYWAYPNFLYILFVGTVVMAVLFDSRPPMDYSQKDRLILFFAFVIGIFLTFSSLYILLNPVGSDLINRDGRYLIPLMPLLLFAAYPSKRVSLHAFEPVMMWGISALMVLMVLAVFFSYHLTCGVNYYASPENCYYPVYKNWMPNQKFIDTTQGITHMNQTFISKCSTFDQLRFWVKDSGNSLINYELEIKDQDSKEILVKKVIQDRIKGVNGWSTVTFEPLNNMLSRSLEVQIHPIDIKNIPVFAVSIRDEYESGDLEINEKEQEYDILFQYHCLLDLSRDLSVFLK